MTQHHPPQDPCTSDCETHDAPHDRRGFLKQGLMAVGALAALGITADRLGALTLSYATGRAQGATLRYPLPTADGATLDAENKVIVARVQGVVYAFSLECPHRGSEVEWQAEQSRFYCPKHKSTFQPEGTFIQGKAERNMDRFVVRIEGNEVVVVTDNKLRSDTQTEAWSAARATTA